MKKFAIIVAGGSGRRMGSEVPKQFLLLNGKPVLIHTLEVFRSVADQVLLVLPAGQVSAWQKLAGDHSFSGGYLLVNGGETRYHSVQNGLAAIQGTEGLVAVHDGVRPLVSAGLVERAYLAASGSGSAVAAVAVKDSLRKISADGTSVLADRDAFRIIQTPQTFRLDWMKKAFQAAYIPAFTDCASVMEHAGFPVHLIEGAYDNIKITTPEDLVLAESFLRLKSEI